MAKDSNGSYRNRRLREEEETFTGAPAAAYAAPKDDYAAPAADYAPGDAYAAGSAAPALPDDYGAQYRDAVRRYTEMAPFSYDYRSDPVYQAYKKEYAREGRRAGEDTLGRYAALTGGMPSTAAVTAAQQAGNYYAAQMADKLPELYDLAYAMYTGEADRLYRQLSALRGARDDELGRWQAALGQWNTERDRADRLDQQAWERQRRETEYADSRADRAEDVAYREKTYEADRADRAYDEADRDRAYEADRADRAYDEADRDRAYEADRADRAYDEADRDRAYEADRADRAYDEAYRDRAYADSRADKEAKAASRGGGSGGTGGQEDAAPEALPVDFSSVLDLGYGPISAERLSELIAAGEVEQYDAGGVLRFRRVNRTADAPVTNSFTERFRERFG